jgi:ferredoxin
MKAKVDHDLCSGDAICVDICPEVFEMSDEDKAVVIVDEIPEEHQDACREAAESCPEGCIYIEE